MIQVTQPYVPSQKKLNRYLSAIHKSAHFTNNGPLVRELTVRLEEFLETSNLLLVANGTLALQIAYKALNVSMADCQRSASVITTPFTFIATSSSLVWERMKLVFSDIDPSTWCMDASLMEQKITESTQAIVPVHVFGNACDVESITAISKDFNIRTIYDACHAFGTKFKGQSLLNYGDASTLSFHATKLFHTVEGGAIRFASQDALERARALINFGIDPVDGSIIDIGVNAKLSEVHAAYGLCVLDDIKFILERKHEIYDAYHKKLNNMFQFQEISESVEFNAAYVPVVLESEDQVNNVLQRLKDHGVIARRYFYPSLSQVSILGAEGECPEAERISSKIICLPTSANLSVKDAEMIASVVIKAAH